MRTGFHQEWNLKTRSLKAALSNGLHKRQRTVDTHSLATNINTNISSSLPSKFKDHSPAFDVDMFAVDKQAAPLALAPAGFTGWRSILIKRAKSAIAFLLGISCLLYLFSSGPPSPFASTFSLSRPPHPHPAVEPEINNSLDVDLLVPAAFSSEKETEETLKCPSLHSTEQIHWSLSPASGEAEEEEELECEPILTLRQLSAKLWTYPRPNPFVVSQCRPPRHLRAQMACNSFVLRIQRKEGCHLPPIEGGGLTRNSQESTLAEELLGPDSFIIDITGSERKSIIRPFRFRRTPVDGEEEIGGGGCEYFFGVEVKNGGSPFRLAVNWVYENWDGMIESFERDGEVYLGKKYEGELVDEKIPRWPVILDTPLLQSSIQRTSRYSIPGLNSEALPIQSLLCPSSCISFSFSPKNQTHLSALKTLDSSSTSTSSPLPDSLDDSEISLENENLPLCPLGSLSGTYLPDPSPQLSFPQSLSEGTGKYGFVPYGCKFDRNTMILLSDNEGLSAEEREVKEACLARKRRIVLRGDSHMRMLYDALVPRLKGEGRNASYEKGVYKKDYIGNVELQFQWDHFLARLTSKQLKRADTFVLSTGAHQAFEHWSTDRFVRGIQSVLGRLSRAFHSGRLPRILFITSPAYPLRNQKYSWDNRDWRTPSRLSSWSGETMEALSRFKEDNLGARMEWFDGFESTLPFARTSIDGAHFRDTMAMEAWLQWTVYNLQLCG